MDKPEKTSKQIVFFWLLLATFFTIYPFTELLPCHDPIPFGTGKAKLESMSNSLTEEEIPDPQVLQRPFVTCQLHGQLANNMNQIATTLAYAWEYDAEPFFPDLNKEIWKISYNRDNFFFRLNPNTPPRSVQYVYNEYDNGGGWWDCKPIPFYPDQDIIGDFFCWKHFHHYRDRLLQVFAPSDKVLDTIYKKYGFLLSNPNTVSIHVRTYNKEYNDNILRCVGLHYYENAINLFPSDTLFVVFSDRINWCKKHFPPMNRNFFFIDENDHVLEFYLMSMLKNHIIANSCYSWWAAYLNNQPNKIVVAPLRCDIHNVKENINLPDWIILIPELSESYPTDIKDYDMISQSVDTQ